MPKEKSVVIIDDHPLAREGLKYIISKNPSFKIVGEAGGGREGFDLVKKIKPDVVIMDVSLPDRSGLEVTRDITIIYPEIKILIVSMHSKIDNITKAFQMGAMGYVLKESIVKRLMEGLETVSRGEHYLDNSVSQTVIEKLLDVPSPEIRMEAKFKKLTPREQEVMRLLAEGLSPKEIGDRLFISAKTVENHRAHVMKKLNFQNTTELIRYAVKHGLVDMEFWDD